MRALLLAICSSLLLCSSGRATALWGADLHPEGSDQSRFLVKREFTLLRQAGADSVRFDVAWDSLEWRRPGREDPHVLSWLDWVMREARAKRLKVILDLVGTPCWASSAPRSLRKNCSPGWWNRGVSNYAPRDPEAYATFAALAVSRWRRALAAVELWNEPNGPYFLSVGNRAQAYAGLVRSTYPKVKSVAPRVPVLMSLGGTDTNFLDELYQFGARGYYDGIAVHPYFQLDLNGLISFRYDQLGRGDSAPLWVTEVGWSSAAVGAHTQAVDISRVMKRLATLPYVAATEIYDVRDSALDPGNAEAHFGMLDFRLHPKPAWRAFVSVLRRLRRGSKWQRSTSEKHRASASSESLF